MDRRHLALEAEFNAIEAMTHRARIPGWSSMPISEREEVKRPALQQNWKRSPGPAGPVRTSGEH